MSDPLFTMAEIDVLNDARTILKDAAKLTPHDWSGGYVQSSLERAADALFEALNHLNAYGVQPLEEWQIHNHASKVGA